MKEVFCVTPGNLSWFGGEGLEKNFDKEMWLVGEGGVRGNQGIEVKQKRQSYYPVKFECNGKSRGCPVVGCFGNAKLVECGGDGLLLIASTDVSPF